MGLDPGQAAQEITRGAETQHPDQRADHVEERELRAVHLGDTGHEGRKGSNEGHEAGHDDRDPAIALIEIMGLQKGAPVEKARLLPLKYLGPEVAADGVIALVAQDGRHDQHRHGHGQTHEAHPTQRTHHEQQGVARQERHHHQARLHEDDQKQEGIHPRPVIAYEGLQVAVHVEDEVDQEGGVFHGERLWPAP